MMHAQELEQAVSKFETVAITANQLKEQCCSLQAEIDRLTTERPQHVEQACNIEACTEILDANKEDMQKQQLITLCSSLYVGSLMHRVLTKDPAEGVLTQSGNMLFLDAFDTESRAEASDQQNTILTMKAELQHADAALEAERAKADELKAELEMMNFAVQIAGEKQESLLTECAMLRAEADARHKFSAPLECSLRQVKQHSLPQHKVSPDDLPRHAVQEHASHLKAGLHEIEHKSLHQQEQQEEAHLERNKVCAEADAWQKSSARLKAQLHEAERKVLQWQVEAQRQEAQLHAEVHAWHKSSVKLEAQLHEAERSLSETQKEAQQNTARLREWQRTSAKLEGELQGMKMLLLQHQEQTHDETARFLYEQKVISDEAFSYKEGLMHEFTMSEYAYGKLQVLEACESSISLEYAAAQEQALAHSSIIKSHTAHLEDAQNVLHELAHLKAAHEAAQENEAILTSEKELANSENSALCTSLQRKATIIQDLRDSKVKLAMQLASNQEELACVKAQHEAVCFEKEGHKETLASYEGVLRNMRDASRALEEKNEDLQTAHLLAQRREVIVTAERDLANSENSALCASVQQSAAMLQETHDSKSQLAQQFTSCHQELVLAKASWSTIVSESESAHMRIADLEDALKAEQEAAAQKADWCAAEMAAREAELQDIRVALLGRSSRQRWTVWPLRIMLQMLLLAAWAFLEDAAGLVPEAKGLYGKLLTIPGEEEKEVALNAESSTVQSQPPIELNLGDLFVKSASDTAVEQPSLDDQKAASEIGDSFWITPRRASQFVASTAAIAMTAFMRHVF